MPERPIRVFSGISLAATAMKKTMAKPGRLSISHNRCPNFSAYKTARTTQPITGQKASPCWEAFQLEHLKKPWLLRLRPIFAQKASRVIGLCLATLGALPAGRNLAARLRCWRLPNMGARGLLYPPPPFFDIHHSFCVDFFSPLLIFVSPRDKMRRINPAASSSGAFRNMPPWRNWQTQGT